MAETTGLLDFFQTPFGQGLLSAGFGGMTAAGRGGQVNTLGAAGVAGLLGYNNAANNVVDRQMKEMQLKWAKDGERFANPSNAGPQAMAIGAQTGSVGPTVQNAALLPQLQSKGQNDYLSYLEQGARIGMKNIEPMFNIHKFKVQGYERDPSKDQYDGNGNLISSGLKLPDGMLRNQDGSVSVANGYISANNAIKGGEAEATEAGKAKYTLLPLGYESQNGPIGGDVYSYLSGNRNQIQPQRSTPANFPRVTPQQQAQRDQISAEVIQYELENETNPARQAMLQRELARRQGGTRLLSETDKKRRETQATSDVAINKDTVAGLVREAESQQGILQTLDTVEGLVKKGTLGNSPLDRMAMTAHNMGLVQTPESTNTANLIKLGSQLVLARGSLGAGVSTADADRYDKAAGEFSRAQSNQERMQYINIMREIAQKQFSRTNQAIQSWRTTGQAPSYPAQQTQPVQQAPVDTGGWSIRRK